MESLRAMRYTIVYGLYILPLLALFVSNNLFFPYISGKNFAFRIIVLLLSGVWFMLMFKDRSVRPKMNPITIVYSVFIFIMTLSTIFGIAPFRSFWSNLERMDGLLHHLHLFLFYLMASSVFTKLEWKRFFGVSIAASVATMAYGAYQLAGVFTITQGGDRLDSTLGNAIYFGGFLLFNLFLAGYLLYEREQLFVSRAVLAGLLLTVFPIVQHANWKLSIFFNGLSQNGLLNMFMLLSFIGVLLSIAGFALLRKYEWQQNVSWALPALLGVSYLYFIYRSGSRGVLVGLVAGVAVSAFFAVYTSSGRARKIATGVLLAVLLLVGGMVGLAQTRFGEGGGVLGRLAFSEIARTIGTRTTLWGLGLEAAQERPILGSGPDTFIMAFSAHYDPVLYDQEPWFDRSHNVFIDWLVHTGILGLLAYIGIFVSAFYVLYRTTAFTPLQKAIVAGVLVAYIGQNFTVFDNLISSIFFYSILAFIVGSSLQKKEEKKTEPVQELPDGMFALVALLVGALVFGGTYGLHVQGVLASRSLLIALKTKQFARYGTAKQAKDAVEAGREAFNTAISYENMVRSEAREQMMQYTQAVVGYESVPESLRITLLNDSLKQLDEEVQHEPLNARAPYFLAALSQRVGQYDQALALFDQALSRSPDRQTFMRDKAVLLNHLGRFDEALATIDKARSLSEKPYQDLEVLFAVMAVNAGHADRLDDLRIPSALLDTRVVSLLLQSNKLDLLESELNKKISEGTQNPNYYLQLAEIWLRRDNRGKAIEVLGEAKRALPDESARFDGAIESINKGN
ncbi:MAG: O-antigen ligase family protein [bacterium]|nr:O-antigen ligase family protein [bacterium]